MSGECAHSYPGEYVVDGMHLAGDFFPKDLLDQIKDSEVFDEGDILISSYPKCGTTWMVELMYLICNDADTDKAKARTTGERVPFLEMRAPGRGPSGFEKLVNKEMEHPRILKTHLPAKYLDKAMQAKKVKTVYVVRNPKDALVSYYHFHKMNKGLGEFQGTWSQFFQKYRDGKIHYGDYFDNVEGWSKYSGNENIIFVTYEDMKADIRGAIRRLATFVNVKLTDEQVEVIVEHTDFKTMRANVDKIMTNAKMYKANFVRKGQVGDWKNHFTPEENEWLDKKYEERMKDIPLSLKFEL